MKSVPRIALRLLLAMAIVFAVAIARQFGIGARSMVASDAALARGDIPAAIDEARAAAEARAPGSPYPARGYERLVAMAQKAEQEGHWSEAARAWRAVRAAALSTRVGAEDGRERLRQANVQLARIGANHRAADTDQTAASLEAQLQEDLARDERPGLFAYAALGAGGLLFYLGIGSLLMQGPQRWPPALTFGLVAAGALLAALGCIS
ncbi:hypothetical protein [Pendulispora albinea]|uniref:DUF4337 domain-containing protein n=1 Tax=Pendulispora albinea TaxID=2741071 RepID=A0ABZ2M6K6_9BACT